MDRHEELSRVQLVGQILRMTSIDMWDVNRPAIAIGDGTFKPSPCVTITVTGTLPLSKEPDWSCELAELKDRIAMLEQQQTRLTPDELCTEMARRLRLGGLCV